MRDEGRYMRRMSYAAERYWSSSCLNTCMICGCKCLFSGRGVFPHLCFCLSDFIMVLSMSQAGLGDEWVYMAQILLMFFFFCLFYNFFLLKGVGQVCAPGRERKCLLGGSVWAISLILVCLPF